MTFAWYVCYVRLRQVNTNNPLVRTSATNCARIYNLSFRKKAYMLLLPHDWPSKLDIDIENVWDAFFL